MTGSSRPWVLVTGGSRGIGRGVAAEMARRGWNVAIAHLRDVEAAAEARAEVESAGGRALVHTGNLGDPAECGRLVEVVREEAGGLRGVVHCAGLGALAPALDGRPGRWRLAWDTHVGALIEILGRGRELLEPGGSVVAVSSLGGRRVLPGYASIGVAKAGLESLVRYLAVELAGSGVAVNAVCGGPVDTDSLRSFAVFGEIDEWSRRSVAGRLGRPEDLAPVVAFLLSPGSRWIRGQVVVADGGLGLV